MLDYSTKFSYERVSMYDCTVVGGGAAGLLVAMTLSETGRRATFEVLHTIAPITGSTPSTPIDWWQYVPRMTHPSKQ